MCRPGGPRRSAKCPKSSGRTASSGHKALLGLGFRAGCQGIRVLVPFLSQVSLSASRATRVLESSREASSACDMPPTPWGDGEELGGHRDASAGLNNGIGFL